MATEAAEEVTNIEELDERRLEKVGRFLLNKYNEYKKDRREAELQWVKNLRQYEGEYDPEVEIPPGRSRAYPKLTRQKCLGMVARLMGLLFPESEPNWGVTASAEPSVDADTLEWIIGQWAMENPEGTVDLDTVHKEIKKFADEAAEKMSRRIDDQLSDTAEYGMVDYPTLARKVIESAVKYGMGVLKGPLTIEAQGVKYGMDETGNIVISNETVYRPYFSSVRLFDYFPDMHAKTLDQLDGEFERHVLSKHQLRKLAKRDDFYEGVIEDYLATHPEGTFEASSFDNDLHSLEGAHLPGGRIQKGKYEAVEYWGPVDRKNLEAAGVSLESDEDEIRATVWFLGDKVIKAAENPYPEGVRTYHVFQFEEDDVNLAGKGLPQVMRDSQMGVSNGSRMMLDNAASVAGPMAEVNTDLLIAEHKPIKFQAFEIIYREGEGAMANGRALTDVSFNSHLSELLATVEHFRSVADEETFVSSQPGGDLAGEAMRTQGNMSMVMGNSSLPFRDIVRNYDNFTISVIHALIQWNRVFNPETNIDGDLRPIAKGSTSLMAKEVRAYALDNLATTLTEQEMPWINMRELAKARVQVRDLPESLMRDEEEVEAELEQQRQEQQRMQEQAQQLATAQQQADTAETVAAAEQKEADAVKKRTEAGVDLVTAMLQARSPEAVGGEQAQQGQPALPSPAGEPNVGI